MPAKDIADIVARLRREETRWEAILDLKLLENKGLISRLLPYLQDPEWIVRWCIAEKLGDVKDPASVRLLCQFLQDTDYHVRKNAVKSLLRFGPDITPVLVDYLPHPAILVRRHVYSLIAHFGHNAVPYLAEQVVLTKDWLVLHHIIHLLYIFGGKKSEAALIKALKHQDHQKSVLLLLGALDSAKALPSMIRLYKNPKLRRCILAAVAQIGYKTAGPVLIMALYKGAPLVRAQAEAMILKIGAAMLPYLVKGLLDSEASPDVLLNLIIKLGPMPVLKSMHRLAERNVLFRERTKAFRKAYPVDTKKGLGGFMDFLGDIGDVLLR